MFAVDVAAICVHCKQLINNVIGHWIVEEVCAGKGALE
jgi:hypothetical protein